MIPYPLFPVCSPATADHAYAAPITDDGAKNKCGPHSRKCITWSIGVTRVLWLEKVADSGNVPTRPELTVGTDLTNAIGCIDGWTLANQPIETPDLGSTFESSIPGSDKADDSSLGFYEDKVSDAIEQLLTKDATGWVVFLRKGDLPGNRAMDVFPVRIGSRSPNYSTDNEAAKFTVSFSITEKPTQDAEAPAADTPPPPKFNK